MATATAAGWRPPTADEVAELFAVLAADWKERSKYMSNTMQMAMLRPYQRIIGLGPAALPHIFAELQRDNGFWFWALEAITGDDPVPPDDKGNVRRMVDAWLAWGQANGFIR